MPPNMIHKNGEEYIHDHGKVFMCKRVYSLGDDSIPKVKKTLRKMHHKFRAVEYEGNVLLFIQMNWCKLPDDYNPYYISEENCANCPDNCTRHGIPVYSQRIDGYGRHFIRMPDILMEQFGFVSGIRTTGTPSWFNDRSTIRNHASSHSTGGHDHVENVNNEILRPGSIVEPAELNLIYNALTHARRNSRRN